MTPAELTLIYKTHNGMVERQAMRVLRDLQNARDVSHEVFIHFIRYAAENEVTNITGLLHRMATQHAIRKLRSVGRHQTHGVVEDRGDPDIIDLDAWRLLRRAIETCGDDVRSQIAVHYFLDGMTQDEIAESMHITRRVVGRHLDRFCEKAKKLAGAGTKDQAEIEPERARSIR